MTVNANSNKVG